jgi:hypothetical protein
MLAEWNPCDILLQKAVVHNCPRFKEDDEDIADRWGKMLVPLVRRGYQS